MKKINEHECYLPKGEDCKVSDDTPWIRCHNCPFKEDFIKDKLYEEYEKAINEKTLPISNRIF